MFNYLKADLYRIFRKRNNYLFYGGLGALFIVMLVLLYNPTGNYFTNYASNPPLSLLYFELGMLALSIGATMIVGAQSYYTVYLEDLSIQNLPNIFTTGLRKHEYLITKVLVHVIYLFAVMLFLGLLYVGGYFVLQTNIADATADISHFILFVQAMLIIYFAILSFSMISHIVAIYFQRSDIPLVFFFILVNGLIAQIFGALSNIEMFSFLSVINDYAISTVHIDVIREGILMMGKSSVLSSSFYEVISLTLSYLVVAFLISWLLLKRVEIKE